MMRFDWFLPALRRSRAAAIKLSWPRRAARAVLPARFFSRAETKQRGLVRQALRRLGPTWLYSPLRRVCQASCFVLFLWLFFVVCWPYSARPVGLGQTWSGWQVSTLTDDGDVVLSRPETQPAATGTADAQAAGSDLAATQAATQAATRAATRAAAQPMNQGAALGATLGAAERILAELPAEGALLYLTPPTTDGSTAAAPMGDSAAAVTAAPASWLVVARETVAQQPGELESPEPAEGSAHLASQLTLRPQFTLDGELLDQLLVGEGTWLLSERAPHAWPAHYTDELARKERIAAEIFLQLDPLVSLSTALAARQFTYALLVAAVIGAICWLIPRGFCGYLCPLGTLIDLFDWGFASRIKRFRVTGSGWWVHLKYYLLLGCLVCSLAGMLVTGYVAAIPVITRGLLFGGEPLQSGLLRGWHLLPAWNGGHVLSVVLFAGVLLLGLLQPRFWCKYVCPSGAVFSLSNLFRLTERKVESSCIHCNKCIEVCPFDAIKADYTTRVTDCTFCQTCGGVCPTHAIKFVDRGDRVELKVLNDPPTGETRWGRRGFLSAAVGSGAAVVGAAALTLATRASARNLDGTPLEPPVRPPGSVPEAQFLQLCIRCGECFKACPNNVLQPMGFQQGLMSLWTPEVVADWAGCEPSCNACGQVCPTGAIRPLPLEEKKAFRMGLAEVNPSTCLPWANREACQLCVDECHTAGYHAIEFRQVHTSVDEQGAPVPGTGYLAPVVLADLCVGCGLCQTRCYGTNVHQKQLLSESAIVICSLL